MTYDDACLNKMMKITDNDNSEVFEALKRCSKTEVRNGYDIDWGDELKDCLYPCPPIQQTDLDYLILLFEEYFIDYPEANIETVMRKIRDAYDNVCLNRNDENN